MLADTKKSQSGILLFAFLVFLSIFISPVEVGNKTGKLKGAGPWPKVRGLIVVIYIKYPLCRLLTRPRPSSTSITTIYYTLRPHFFFYSLRFFGGTRSKSHWLVQDTVFKLFSIMLYNNYKTRLFTAERKKTQKWKTTLF